MRRARTRKNKGGGYPFVGEPYAQGNLNTWGNSNYYVNNENPIIFLHNRPIGGKRKKRTHKRRYAGGDDRFNSFSLFDRLSNQSINMIRMTQGKELLPVGNVLHQPIMKNI